MLVNNARTPSVVAIFRRVADGISHVPEPALIEQVDDELQLMQTLEIRDLGLISRFDQRLERGLYQRTHTPAKHRLLAEKITLSLLFECRFDNACLQIAGRPRVRQRVLLRLATNILMNR